MSKLATKMILLVVLGASALITGAQASERDQKTILTFSGPVEIPGQVLPAGTYVFKLLDSPSNRQVVQVFNKDENKIFGTFLTIPDYRLRPAEEAVIHFHERPAGQPDAIRAWFYPGRNYGHVFVYPKSEARVLAEANQTPVPAMPVELEREVAQPTVTPTAPEIRVMVVMPLMAEVPNGREVQLAQVFAEEEPQTADAQEELPTELPETATSLPLFAMIGAAALIAAVVAGRAVKVK